MKKKLKDGAAERQEEILRRVRSAMEAETPDLWERIDRRLGPAEAMNAPVSTGRRLPEKRLPVKRLPVKRLAAIRTAAAAACLLLGVSAAAGGFWLWSRSGSSPPPVLSGENAAPYLFIVYSRASVSGYAGRAVARADEPIVFLSADGHNQLSAIGDPWATADGLEYRMDIDLQFSFMGDTIESVTYTKEADEDVLLLGTPGRPSSAGEEKSSDSDTAATAEEDRQEIFLLDESVSINHWTLSYATQSNPFLYLRFRLDAAPYEELGTVDKLSAVYDAFREAIRRTALTAEIRYRDGSRDIVRLQLGIDETNTHAVTVTLQPDGIE